MIISQEKPQCSRLSSKVDRRFKMHNFSKAHMHFPLECHLKPIYQEFQLLKMCNQMLDVVEEDLNLEHDVV